MSTAARSLSPFAAQLVGGPLDRGVALGHGYVLFGSRVLAVTPTGAPRMPNGIEADLALAPGEDVLVGGGELRTRSASIGAGPLWNPRPVPRFSLALRPSPTLRLAHLTGRGPGLTPLGDDVLLGYFAGRALAGPASPLISAWATVAAAQTTALSGTLLQLGAVGLLPEVAHRLLEDGDPEPLLGFGATSGAGIAVGLALAERGTAPDPILTVELRLPLDGADTSMELLVSPIHTASRLLAPAATDA